MSDENKYVGKKVKVVPNEPPKTNIDTKDNFNDVLLETAETGSLKTDVLEQFSTTAQSREAEYELIDTMGMDSTIAAALETYAEDMTQTNSKGQIFWCESDDPSVAKYVSYLIDKIDFDKQAFSWAYNLVKYGDVYVRLIRQSDFDNSRIFGREKDKKSSLKENVNVVITGKNDHYVDTLERVRNPNEMFELTKFGKSIGYIQAPVNVQRDFKNNNDIYSYVTYKMRQKDVYVYSPTDFAHACLESSTSRSEEDLDLFLNDDDYKDGVNAETYQIRRGTGILNDLFKTWRELTLLENSVLLNRITRSGVVRVVQPEVGDMPKNQVQVLNNRIKSMFEQKESLDINNKMSEYVNPGPVENFIVLPTRSGKGQLNITTVGGDVDPKTLTDLAWFADKLYGGLKIPKQYLGKTDDSTGFNGGSSLTIISSRYAKTIKRGQKALIQMVTDIINLLLIDKGNSNMINNFRIKMQTPVTQEDIDAKSDLSNSLRNVSDIMQTLSDIQTPEIKLKVLKGLLSDVLANQDVTNAIQEEIDRIEKEGNKEENNPEEQNDENPFDLGGNSSDEEYNEEPSLEPIETSEPEPESEELSNEEELSTSEEAENEADLEETVPEESNENGEVMGESLESDDLPSFESLGIDGTKTERR